MKDMIQRMTDLENNKKQELTESRRIAECPPEQAEAAPVTPQASEGTPVSVNVNMTASGKEHVGDLLAMMKSAGLDNAQQMKPDMMPPMRQDMDRLKAIIDEPEMETDVTYSDEFDDDLEEYDNEPDEKYKDHEFMTHDLSGGINRRKKSYSDAEDGDNAMTIESIKNQLYAALSEKKAKPDYIDLDGDSDTKEPMKKAAKDKKSKKKNKVNEDSESDTTTFLILERIDGKLGSKWSLMRHKKGPGSNPQYLRKMLNKHAESLGWDGYDVVAQWSGNIDEVIDDAEDKLSSDQNWVNSYKMELKSRIRDLTKAKEIMSSGQQVQPES